MDFVKHIRYDCVGWIGGYFTMPSSVPICPMDVHIFIDCAQHFQIFHSFALDGHRSLIRLTSTPIFVAIVDSTLDVPLRPSYRDALSSVASGFSKVRIHTWGTWDVDDSDANSMSAFVSNDNTEKGNFKQPETILFHENHLQLDQTFILFMEDISWKWSLAKLGSKSAIKSMHAICTYSARVKSWWKQLYTGMQRIPIENWVWQWW